MSVLSLPAPPFPVPGYLDVLEGEASSEGFLDRLFGTNCFSAAVGELAADCRRMDQEAKTRLALRFAIALAAAACEEATQATLPWRRQHKPNQTVCLIPRTTIAG